MRSKSIMLTTAMFIGVTALAVSTAARATTWVAVPDDSDYVAQQTYVYDPYDAGPSYNGPSYVERDYAPAPRTVVTRERTYNQPAYSGRTYNQPAYAGTQDTLRVAEPAYVGASVSDSCYVRREPGLFGGWHEYRDCP